MSLKAIAERATKDAHRAEDLAIAIGVLDGEHYQDHVLVKISIEFVGSSYGYKAESLIREEFNKAWTSIRASALQSAQQELAEIMARYSPLLAEATNG